VTALDRLRFRLARRLGGLPRARAARRWRCSCCVEVADEVAAMLAA
jgi:hypothetical protein